MSLHEQILAEIERREQIAREIEGVIGFSPWVVEYLGTTQRITNAQAFVIAETHVGSPLPGNRALWAPEPEHIALHDPADALRRYAAARRVLERHAPIIERPYRKAKCRHAQGAGVSWVVDWPCPDIEDLADSLGIDLVDGGEVR